MYVDPGEVCARFIPEPFRYFAHVDQRARDLTGINAVFAPFARTRGARGSLQFGRGKLTIPAVSGACGIELRLALPAPPGHPLLEIGDELVSSSGAIASATNLVLRDALDVHILEPTITALFLWRRPLTTDELTHYPQLITICPVDPHPALLEKPIPAYLARSGLVAKERPATIPLGQSPPFTALIAGEIQPLPVAAADLERHLQWLAPTIDNVDDVLALLYAYEELVNAMPLVEEGSAKVVGHKSVRFIEAWRAPHVDDDELVFFAAGRTQGLHEVRVHLARFFVEVTPIASAPFGLL